MVSVTLVSENKKSVWVEKHYKGYACGISLTQIPSVCVVIFTFLLLDYIPWSQKYNTLKCQVYIFWNVVCVLTIKWPGNVKCTLF
jgi:hypothetical protein